MEAPHLEGVVTWPVLIFIATVSVSCVYGAIRIVIYAFNIRRDIDARMMNLATRSDIAKLFERIESATREVNGRFDTIWNEGTSRHNDVLREINQINERVSHLEGLMGRRGIYGGGS